MIRAARLLLEAGARAAQCASSVINVSSVAALNTTGSSIAYAASKAALGAVALALARTLAPLIRANALCLGYTDTPWWTRGVGQERADKLREVVKSAVPLRVAPHRKTSPEVVTGAIGPADAVVLLIVPVSATDADR